MRIWDLDPHILCRQHLLGEHRELHGLWNVLTQGKKGYSHHPETLRWVGRTRALAARHDALVAEMARRGYNHQSPLPPGPLEGPARNERRVESEEEQVEWIRSKGCDCRV